MELCQAKENLKSNMSIYTVEVAKSFQREVAIQLLKLTRSIHEIFTETVKETSIVLVVCDD